MRLPRRVLVLGGTGFVGARLLHRLGSQLEHLRVLTRNRDAHRHIALLPKVELCNADVYDPMALRRACTGMDAVINLVGILNAPGRSGKGFERAHAQLTSGLIEAAEAAEVPRLLQMSSLGAGRGESHYLRSRGAAEARVRASRLDWTIYRPSVIFGPGDGLFCRFAALLKLLPGLLPLARAQARMQPVYVGDVVAAMARTLPDPDAFGQTYELGGPQVLTLAEIVRYTATQLGRHVTILPLPDFIGRLQGLAFDFMPMALKAFSSDNFKSLKLDSVTTRHDLEALGVPPTPIAAIVPAMLGRMDRQQQLDDLRQRRD